MAPQDPSISPYEFGSVGSRGTYAMGAGIFKAAEDARRQLFDLAALSLMQILEPWRPRTG
jgi:xanthine dehydrogenase molybdenum-binding subunit